MYFYRPQLQLKDKGNILLEKVFTIMMMGGGNWTTLLLCLNPNVISPWLLLMAGCTWQEVKTPGVIWETFTSMTLKRTGGSPCDQWGERLGMIVTWYIWMVSYTSFLLIIYQMTCNGMTCRRTDGIRYNQSRFAPGDLLLWLLKGESLLVFMFLKKYLTLMIILIIMSC